MVSVLARGDPVVRVNFSLSAGTGGRFGASGTLGIVIGVCRGLLSTGIIAASISVIIEITSQCREKLGQCRGWPRKFLVLS